MEKWKEIPFEPLEEQSEMGQYGWIWPKEGIISASSKPVLEHERAHVELGHAILGKRMKGKRDSLAYLKREMDAYAFPLAKGRFTVDEFLDEWHILETSSESELESLSRQLGNSLLRLYRKNLITKEEYQTTKDLVYEKIK